MTRKYVTEYKCHPDMEELYVWRYECHPDIEKLRELLTKVTDEQKLNILQQTKNEWDMTALHEAADRDDAEMITTILSSLQSSDRLDLLMMSRSEEHTSELQSHSDLVCRLLLEKKKKTKK